MNTDTARRGLVRAMLVSGALLIAGPAVAQQAPQELPPSQDTGLMSDAEYYEYYTGGFDAQNEADDWFFDYYGWDTEALQGDATSTELERDAFEAPDDDPMLDYEYGADLFDQEGGGGFQ